MELSYALTDANRFANPSAASRGAAMGASWEANAINGDNWTTGGWVAWLRRYSKGAVDIPMSRVYATWGKRSDEIITLHLDKCLADKPAWCFVDVSGNDIMQGIPVSILISNVKTIVNALQENGTYPILMPCRALGNGLLNGVVDVVLTDKSVAQFNNWVKLYSEANNGVGYWDVNPDFIDFSNGRARAVLVQTDNVHDTTQGAQTRGLSAWNYIKSLLTVRDSRFTLAFDKFDAVGNPAGNMLDNGLFSGNTAGLADGWSLITFGGTTGTFAPSKIAYAGYTGLDKQRLTLGGTGDGITGTLAYTVSTSNWAEGDIVWAEIEVDYNITSGGLSGIYLSASQNQGGTLGRDGEPTGYGDWLPGSGSLVLRTDPFSIPHPSTVLYLTASVRPAVGAVAGTVDFARASLRKLIQV